MYNIFPFDYYKIVALFSFLGLESIVSAIVCESACSVSQMTKGYAQRDIFHAHVKAGFPRGEIKKLALTWAPTIAVHIGTDVDSVMLMIDQA